MVESLRLDRFLKKQVLGAAFTQKSSRITWSVIDQAAFSGAGLFMNMFLIWALSGDGYGQFAVTFAVFLMLSGAHDSFVLEPVSVLGSSVPPEELGGYLSILLLLHMAVCVVVSAVSVLVFAFISLGGLHELLFVMALMLPLILLSWTARRLCYITSQSRVAAFGSFVYLVSTVGLIALAEWLGWLTPALAFVIMGVASIPATAIILAKIPVGPTWSTSRLDARKALVVFKEHWLLGRWVALQKFFLTATGQLGIFMTGLVVSVAAAGVLRALTFTVMPLLQITAAISGMLALPIVAREYGRGNLPRVRELSTKLTIGLVVLAVGYLAMLTVLQQPISRFISMAGDVPSTWLVALKGVSPVVAALGAGAAIALRATQRVAYYPLSTAIPGIFAAISTPLLVMSWGLTGAIVSGLAATVVSTAVGIGLYRRWV